MRRVTNFSLSEAKAYVASLPDAPPLASLSRNQHGTQPASLDLDPALAAQVQQLVNQGQPLEAIKHLRHQTHISLAAAKAYVDDLRRGSS